MNHAATINLDDLRPVRRCWRESLRVAKPLLEDHAGLSAVAVGFGLRVGIL